MGAGVQKLQKVKMQDITPLLSKTGETFYNIKVNVAKKRNITCIREIVIKSEEFEAIQKAHENYFNDKNLDSRRTYLFQKPNINLKIIKLALSIFLKNLKFFLKNQAFVLINLFIYLEIYLFQI